MGKPVYDDGKVHILSEKCSTCVFRPGNLMSLQPGRLKNMVDTSIASESGIVCHQTIFDQHEQEALCRGFYDSYGDQTMTIRAARMFGVVKEIDPPKKGDPKDGQAQ